VKFPVSTYITSGATREPKGAKPLTTINPPYKKKYSLLIYILATYGLFYFNNYVRWTPKKC